MAGWLASAGFAYAAYCYVFPTPLTLVHELGHALLTLALTRGRVVLYLGRQPPPRTWTLRRLELQARFLNHPRWGWYGRVEYLGNEGVGRVRSLATVLAGPLASAIVCGALVVAALTIPFPPALIVWTAAGAAGFQVAVTAIPFRYPRWFGPYAGRVSDGYRIVQMLRPTAS